MFPLSLEAKLIAYALAAAALLGGLAWLLNSHDAEVRAEVTDAVKATGVAAAASSAITEARWQAKTEETVHVAQAQIQAASAAAASTARERDAARMQLNAYLRSRAVPSDPAASSGGPPTADPDVLLAGLLNESWDRNVSLAEETGKRGIAGAACEQWADALSTK